MSMGKKDMTAQVSPEDHGAGDGDEGRGQPGTQDGCEFRATHLRRTEFTCQPTFGQDHGPPLLPLQGTRTQLQAVRVTGKSETVFYHSL